MTRKRKNYNDKAPYLVKKPNKVKNNPMTIEAITLEFMDRKNNNGTNCDNTYRTYYEVLRRIKRNSGVWFNKTIDKIARKEVEDFLNLEREKGYAQNTLKKDYQMLKQPFGIALERKLITEDFFAGYYGIKMPKSIVKEEKVTSFIFDDLKRLLEYLYSPNFKYSHRDEFLIAIHSGLRIGEVLELTFYLEHYNMCLNIPLEILNFHHNLLDYLFLSEI